MALLQVYFFQIAVALPVPDCGLTDSPGLTEAKIHADLMNSKRLPVGTDVMISEIPFTAVLPPLVSPPFKSARGWLNRLRHFAELKPLHVVVCSALLGFSVASVCSWLILK